MFSSNIISCFFFFFKLGFFKRKKINPDQRQQELVQESADTTDIDLHA